MSRQHVIPPSSHPAAGAFFTHDWNPTMGPRAAADKYCEVRSKVASRSYSLETRHFTRNRISSISCRGGPTLKSHITAAFRQSCGKLMNLKLPQRESVQGIWVCPQLWMYM